MKLSLVLCTYNRAHSLAMVLDKVAASILPSAVEWEVLVVDNNSTDRTRDVVERVCLRDPVHFRYVFERRQGLSYARNAGIRESRGDIVAFTDDDVSVEPDWLWKLTSGLKDGEWMGAGGRIVPEWAKPLPSWLSTKDQRTMGTFGAFEPDTGAGPLTRPPYGGNMAFCRKAFEKYGCFRTDLGRSGGNLQGREDIEFAGRVLAGGDRVRYEPCAVVRHLVPGYKMEKGYVLSWWYWYGRSEVTEAGPPSDMNWFLGRIPRCVLRRLLRWTLQWMISVGVRRRFAAKRNVWYLFGIVLACYQWRRRPIEEQQVADSVRAPSIAETANVRHQR